MDTSAITIDILYCYAQEDKVLRDELAMHLSSLKHQRHITQWHNSEILPGAEWQKEIEIHLNKAHIILLLISPSFMNSDYCYSIEMKTAIKRHWAGEAYVIPIILRPVIWEDAPFSTLQILPRNGIPVTRWQDRDDAFWNIAKEIIQVVKKAILSLYTEEERLQKENLRAKKALEMYKFYDNKLFAYEEAINLGSKDFVVRALKAYVLNSLGRYEEALKACEEAILLDPGNVMAYANKGYALNRLGRFEEGLQACEKTIQLDPLYAIAYNNKGFALAGLKQYNEALDAYEQAVRLEPHVAMVYHNMGDIFISLRRYEEAEQAYRKAHELDYVSEAESFLAEFYSPQLSTGERAFE